MMNDRRIIIEPDVMKKITVLTTHKIEFISR